jgi:8-oxo-dGTP pyrophosphatase MutT (NUDIX family)
VAVIVVSKDRKKDRKVLVGKRGDGQGWCLPGGKVDPGESFCEAAERELWEETGIICSKAPRRLGVVGKSLVKVNLHDGRGPVEMYTCPTIYKVSFWEGSPKPTQELNNLTWFTKDDFRTFRLFEPTKKAFEEYIFKMRDVI